MEIINQQVVSVFAEYPPVFRKKLEGLRKIILKVGKRNPEIGALEETLKWGEPSYLPLKKGVGTTVRIHWLNSKPNQYAVYFSCQTTLISKFKKKYPGIFKYEGKRAIIFFKDDEIPTKEIQDCILIALTYHLNKKLI
ncbi:MAG: DUF1801 domain-containing protein [Bdellovibrionaceae bacterium]|nr:DUF1801 domain-containing protein [Pseudobdellovibrionaceae bacterium]